MSQERDVLNTIALNIEKAGFRTVKWGEPTRPPRASAVHIWYVGEFEKLKTLSNVMVTEAIRVRAHWRRPASEDVRIEQEGEIWEATRALQKALRADSQLGGNVTDLEVGDAVTGFVEISGSMQRVVTFDLHCIMLEEEAITA